MDADKLLKRKKESSKDKSAVKKEKKQQDPSSLTPNVVDKPKRKRESTDDPTKKKKKLKKETKTTIPEIEIDVSAPTPPSKKALRLQKKGKPVPPLPSTSQPPPSDVVDSVHPDRKNLVKEIPRAEYSVWIGNLSYKSDVKALRGWLVRGDKRITDKEITRMHLPLNANEQSKGFAYVDFTSKEAMDMVISRSEEDLDGRNLLIKDAKNFSGRPLEKKPRYQAKATEVGETENAGGRVAAMDESAVTVDVKTKPEVSREANGVKTEKKKGGWAKKKEANAKHKRQRTNVEEV